MIIDFDNPVVGQLIHNIIRQFLPFDPEKTNMAAYSIINFLKNVQIGTPNNYSIDPPNEPQEQPIDPEKVHSYFSRNLMRFVSYHEVKKEKFDNNIKLQRKFFKVDCEVDETKKELYYIGGTDKILIGFITVDKIYFLNKD